MGNKTGIWKRTARLARRLYHTLNNYRAQSKDIDFRAFSSMEYASASPEQLKDLKRLDYFKRIHLAKKGYIDDNLKSLLTQGREKERFARYDHRILPIGSFRVLENENPICRIKLGFESSAKTFFMASNDHDNIPLWKPYDGPRLLQSVSALHPTENSTLLFDHTFLGPNWTSNEKGDRDRIDAFYNRAVREAFHSNPYFKASLLVPNEEVLSKPDLYLGKQLHLPISEGESTLMTLTEATERYLVFQSFLKTAPKPESLYFSTQEFKERFLDNKIELIAYLKHGLRLGIHRGILYVGSTEKTNGKIRLQWETYERRMQSETLSARVKYYLSKEIITKKNFMVEKDAIVLKKGMQTAYLKKHYATGEWHYAEVQKSHDGLNFRPVDQQLLNYIRNQYTPSRNLDIAFKQIGTATKTQTIKIQ